jgi:hypothetical protein
MARLALPSGRFASGHGFETTLTGYELIFLGGDWDIQGRF